MIQFWLYKFEMKSLKSAYEKKFHANGVFTPLPAMSEPFTSISLPIMFSFHPVCLLGCPTLNILHPMFMAQIYVIIYVKRKEFSRTKHFLITLVTARSPCVQTQEKGTIWFSGSLRMLTQLSLSLAQLSPSFFCHSPTQPQLKLG